jgi:hypothetical protein
MICNLKLTDIVEMKEHQSKTNHDNFEFSVSIEAYSDDMQYGYDFYKKLQK